MEIYHQLGFRHQWNFSSLAKDRVGNGVIISPRHMERSAVESIDPAELRDYIFDPRFFLPRTPKGKLSTYDFFPQKVAEGFSTSEYSEDRAGGEASAAEESARGCVGFQVDSGFRYVVIPTRHVAGAPGDFIAQQQRLFVEPFLNESPPRPLLQLIVNGLMLKESDFVADLLNWVTGIEGLAGIYLIFDTDRRSKQVKDIDFLYSGLHLIRSLAQNDLDVVVGYTNTEALLYSIAGPRAVTIGCYENTRNFDIRTFEMEEEGSQTQGPTPRLYISKLLQWVDNRYLGAIRRALPEAADFFDENYHQAEIFKPEFKWHFQSPSLYKHAMMEFGRQLRQVGDLEGRDRYTAVRDMINTAREWFNKLDERGVALNSDSDGSHLAPWLTAANQFANDVGWR